MDLSPRVQQAPKLGESLELPLGPPVSPEVPLSQQVVLCSVDSLNSRHLVAAAPRAARGIVKCFAVAVLCCVVGLWSVL